MSTATRGFVRKALRNGGVASRHLKDFIGSGAKRQKKKVVINTIYTPGEYRKAEDGARNNKRKRR